MAVFNKELEAKEEALKPRGPSGPKPGQKSLIVLAFILALVAAIFGAWKIYQVLYLLLVKRGLGRPALYDLELQSILHHKHPFQGFLGGLAAQELARMLEGENCHFLVTKPFKTVFRGEIQLLHILLSLFLGHQTFFI